VGYAPLFVGVHIPAACRAANRRPVQVSVPVNRFRHCGPVARRPPGHNVWNNHEGFCRDTCANSVEAGISNNNTLENP